LTFHSSTWIKNLHALHLDEWRFLLVKGFYYHFIENLKKNQFSGVERTVRALGADGPRVFDIYLISEIFAKSFRENALPGGRSVILNRTECSSVDRADGPRHARGQSAGPRRTVRVVLADGLPDPTVSLASR
jgi:hypothetical protein